MILDRYLTRQFIPIFFFASLMFVMIVSLIDLFTNLVRYLNYEVSLLEILRVSLLYMPKSFSYALPISLLFASAYTLGDLYARNELTAIFSSGIPFWRFCIPLIIIGLLASLFAFFFEDRVVIPTLRMKNNLSRVLLHQQLPEKQSDIVIMARGGKLYYSIDYFDRTAETLNGVVIIEKDDRGNFAFLVRAPRATWTGEYWALSNALIYEWQDGFILPRSLDASGMYREQPDTFRRNEVNVEDLSARDAMLFIKDLRAAGLPVTSVLADYYRRFSFSAVSFVVMILSISMGGRFRKNIMLMSLLASLGAAVFFYVMEMITMMMGRLGYISPVAGAWFPVGIFIIAGVVFLQSAKT
ncbi:membrane protein [Spirochaetia bacterium]|nr:membrane protein [Spirochaetia bacterium]